MSGATGTWLDSRAVAALTVGAVGLFLFNIVYGPLAIVLGAMAARRGRPGRLGRAAGRVGSGVPQQQFVTGREDVDQG